MNSRKLLISAAAAVLMGLGLSAQAAERTRDAGEGDSVLWYEKPAPTWPLDGLEEARNTPGAPLNQYWREALPIGNGRLGGMIFGGISKEHIFFNEDSLWCAGEDGRGDYQAFGDIYVEMSHKDTDATKYRRQLDLGNAVHTTTYTVGDTTYSRESFSSYPANVMVFHFTADKKGAYSGKISLADAHNGEIKAEGNRIISLGSVGGDKGNIRLQYEAQLLVLNQGGSLKTTDNSITFDNCDSLTLMLAAGTDYTNRRDQGWHGEHPHERLKANLAAASKNSFDALRKEHIKDYQKLFNRFSLKLGATPGNMAQQPTDARLAAYRTGAPDFELEELVFNYARYLIISASRPGSLPANLQGLWNPKNQPNWGSDYHTDINFQMTYWIVDPANLAECFQPYAEYIHSIRPTRTEKTREGLKVRGWTTAHNGNIFGGSGWKWSRGSSSWLAQNLWDHYAFTLDEDYLRTRAYPVMKELCEFWEDLLKELPDGTLVSPDGYSPEHPPEKEDGVSFDQQLAWDVFNNYIEGASALGVDKEYREKVASMKGKLLGPKIGKWGQLQEWMVDRDDPNDTHRHLSHLIAVHPGRQISPVTTPKLAEAAKVSVSARGDGGERAWRGGLDEGFPYAWKVNIWARLHDGNRAYKILNAHLQRSFANNLTHINCLDGNFGHAAGICEMLMQSHMGEIHLLPALPDTWANGQVKGIRARGAFEVDMDWTDGKLSQAVIRSEKGQICRLRSAAPLTVMQGGKKVATKTVEADLIEFPTKKGKEYLLKPNAE
jgi:alpha-L-fucosidase 2